MRIAFFDSGLGGITVLSEAIDRMPQEDWLYYADTLHVPYGPKPMEQVKGFILDAVEAIMRQEVKALVIACNTATSIAIGELRRLYPHIPIIGMEPAVKPAVEMNRPTGRRVLVLATQLTLQLTKYQELVGRVDDMSIVDSLPLPELVQYCEALNFDETELPEYFHRKLASYKLEEYGTIVLGCTHYPFYKRMLERILPTHLSIIDGSRGTVKRLQEQLARFDLVEGGAPEGRGTIRFLCSGGEEAYIRKMQQALELYRSIQ
ncbi:glutamate racemase [Paenibacillus koleovorans]|uniref:glutamate racemase n=1 Tax=Paenibacillus koleovorans TaxID=121608 RepID=UPI000FDB7943|nr:glutamate racemase [Paenibacillus koleovorans]